MNTDIYAERLRHVQEAMRGRWLDFLMVGPSADLRYLTGIDQKPSERMSLLIVPVLGPSRMVVPAFEAPSLPELPGDVVIVPWGESEIPARVVAHVVEAAMAARPHGAACNVGVGDRLLANFLLSLQAELPRASFTHAAPVLSALRQIKAQAEIDPLRRSGAAADEVFEEIVLRPFRGRTEHDIARDLKGLLEERGLDVPGMPIVASGPNSASPHHHAGERRIEKGDMIVLDFGGTLEGYYSDITRTVFVGDAPAPGSPEAEVYSVVADAQERAFRAATPGITCESLDAVARTVIEQAGYGEFFNHRLGHGIGLDGHETPYLVSGNGTRLVSGMCFSIEPGIYLPGKFGVRIEDIVALHDTGAERLNNVSRETVVVG